METLITDNTQPPFDETLIAITDYVINYSSPSKLALETAQCALADSLGVAMLALTFPACKKLLGPWVEGCHIEQGVRVPGTNFELDPIKAAFDIGTTIRWLDYNDTWLAQEWGHPSDNLGALLSVMDFVSRRVSHFNKNYTVKDLLHAMVQAYEIQGVLALENGFNQVGLDHVILVKVASVALATKLLGGNEEHILYALSQAWIDGQCLRTYRHAPNTGSRKSWAAGDATSRALRLALLTIQGEKGYRSPISAPKWGFSDVLFKKQPIKIARPLSCYVMENILFKITYPAEFHAQTAVECALKCHLAVKHRLAQIKQIILYTQSAAMKIINKTGPLYNPADRDHCLQYMVAVALLHGQLTAESYEDKAAQNPLIDILRSKMLVQEEERFSQDYLDPTKRTIANRIVIKFMDGTILEQTVECPLGHRARREEGIPLLWEKFEKNLYSTLEKNKALALIQLMQSPILPEMPITEFMQQWQR